MQDLSTPAARSELVRIISRLFAAFLLFWVFNEVSRLPNEVLNLVHNMHQATRYDWSFATSYGVEYMILGLAVDVVSIVVLLMVARWFYRCDPRVQRFFSAEAD